MPCLKSCLFSFLRSKVFLEVSTIAFILGGNEFVRVAFKIPLLSTFAILI